MPRKFIKRYLPDAEKVRRHPHLARFGTRLHDPNLWHLNRRSISGAMAVGLFCALLPLPGQMVIAAALAIWARVNLPASVALVWITNPLTMGPIFYGTYRLGSWMLGSTPEVGGMELSSAALLQSMEEIWEPLLLGSLVTGLVAAVLGFGLVRLAWRYYVLRRCRRHHPGLFGRPRR
ncbi:DUF2062 domain-containing protein [Thiohalobacter sp. IOR34]|uniref:DUF2062 domain-containing protein n=1 Tax=Thiohalobacter sp. IOR34 TaxID=3057176 RepID=UPI0025B1C0F0|nr:DUF2062 domain-containing protein [Thiohalobacter sp. IOR34]WJW76776.1 DUF2062 domain-containing protein [Thiohalobacter sp. IOR34]